MEQTVDNSGRIAIPKRVREESGLNPGSVAEIRIVEGGVLLVPKGKSRRMSELLDYLDEMRKTHKVRLTKDELLEACDRALEEL